MSKSSAAVFLKWIVFEKPSEYPKITHEIISSMSFPRKEKSIPVIREHVEKLGNSKIISEFNDAWNVYRIIPRIEKELELRPLLPGGYKNNPNSRLR